MKWRLSSLFASSLVACLGDVEVPPEPPTVSPVATPTQVPRQTIRGTKPKGTAVLDGGQVVVAADDAESYTFEKTLALGDNRLDLTSQRPSGLPSRKHTEASIFYEPLCPGQATLDPVQSPTQSAAVHLHGTKPVGTALWLDDLELVPLGDQTEFDHNLLLPSDGVFDHALITRDARGKASDPLRFRIVRDTTPPSIAVRFPAPDALDVPTNALISIRFDEPLGFVDGVPDPGVLTLSGPSGSVQGLVVSQLESHAVTFDPGGSLVPATVYTVEIDPTKIPDASGNALASALLRYTFTTALAEDLAPPPLPTLAAVPATVDVPLVMLSGTKAADTSIRINGREVVSIDDATTWSFGLGVPVGTSSISVAARSSADLEARLPDVLIERVVSRPAAPVLAADTPTTVTEPTVTLRGTKPAGTSILLGGNPVVCTGPETEWSFVASLLPGVNELKLQAQDEAGVLSDATIALVKYERRFEGVVPDGFTLKIELVLRDLANVPGIREEFVTGASNYGLDVWIEGPLADGETCVFQGGHRQNIQYVATIEHYIGTKSQHRVPFVDDDYRGTDYLAALITAGVFEFQGISATSPRRDASGRELSDLLVGVTEEELRQNFDCLGAVGVDTCTSATVRFGRKVFAPWTPRKRNGRGLLEQGEYLLFILINLDRDGSWLTANDYETCWGDVAHDQRGMHRFVHRISLGADPYTLVLPQSDELSGVDREGSEKLRFVTPEGVTISWGP